MGAVVLFFGSVNQVLVRLWARVTQGRLFSFRTGDWWRVPLFSHVSDWDVFP